MNSSSSAVPELESTRDAVETAISLAKTRDRTSWESSVRPFSGRVPRWSERPVIPQVQPNRKTGAEKTGADSVGDQEGDSGTSGVLSGVSGAS